MPPFFFCPADGCFFPGPRFQIGTENKVRGKKKLVSGAKRRMEWSAISRRLENWGAVVPSEKARRARHPPPAVPRTDPTVGPVDPGDAGAIVRRLVSDGYCPLGGAERSHESVVGGNVRKHRGDQGHG